ncbi:DEAD/DEAH box helicase [Maribellus comscasis]|uniref:DEAD/DEAH box helicase n=1 Tax=Maribellus comscasis TaxID=2681766 RepID=A0A6I6K2X7_9BACT|nr:DEAD/DEAH box helicase family protein [Maribellus comscasis]QGY45893.1 DEAD/DEAH box helicase [Maribellus comscasis]
MKLQFDANQNYQIQAINAITGIFEGQPLNEANTSFHIDKEDKLKLISGVGNNLILSEEQITENLKTIQSENEISVSESLEGMNFSVEMETGTGKTYVYLRTIYELSKQFGFKKFVIVVPSVAIREGVLKNLQITHDHFQGIYDKTPLNFQVYDSKRVSNLRSFASNNNIEILVINIDSFAKDLNIINRPNDKLTGQRPVEFIQATNPIVIVDEPQNMETEIRKKAIANLNPLCTLRYSATHLNLYNLVYSLNPVKAYDLGLVKQIEVDSVISENSSNQAFIQVEATNATKTRVSAKIKIDTNSDSGVKKKSVTVKVGDDIYNLSNEREIYKEGFLIEEIDASNQCITLSNGSIMYVGDSQGGMSDEIMKFQIRKTIEEHLKKEKRLNPKGIKVLSLFFIDKVSNYRNYDDSGNPLQGKFAKWFEEIYTEFISQPAFSELNKFDIANVHNGYFSADKKGRFKDTSGETQADDDTYKLIMQDKEKLLDIENPLRFIFSHSALREGWDNPNVFQICTLNETKSDIKKRQEIGRGLRLSVNQEGIRSYDRNINRLTVIANEAYEDFAKTLQTEIEEDCGVSFEGRIKNKTERTRINYRKGFEADPKFLEIWERIKHKTTYQVSYNTDDLIKVAGKQIKDLPKIQPPSVRSTKVSLSMTKSGIDTNYVAEKKEVYGLKFPIPDVLGYIQHRTELTRSTILTILKESGKIEEILINPQLFLDLAVSSIRKTLNDLMVEGIKYEKIGTSEYEMRLFDENEIETYLDSLTFEVNDVSKTIYEKYIPLDSNVESQFAKDCETSEQVEFYFKLPFWFKIPTPIGTYNPDWAVVMKDEKKIYFVAETKSTTDKDKLRKEEQQKIQCGERHFEVFDEVNFKHVTKVSELL